jgi:hypothetical protein
MKYQLETIPVHEAYAVGGECPLCTLQAAAEVSQVQFFLGNSVMVPEMRLQVNDAAFCSRHFSMLLGGANQLGLSLITQTHLADLRRRLRARTQAIAPGSRGAARRLARGVEELSEFIREQSARCLVCDRMRERLDRYTFTVAWLWSKEPEFRGILKTSRGFCLPHLADQLAMGVETLGAAAGEFTSAVMEVQERGLDRLDAELLAFAGRFDYRTRGRAPESTRDSVAEAIQKLTGEWLTRPVARGR